PDIVVKTSGVFAATGGLVLSGAVASANSSTYSVSMTGGLTASGTATQSTTGVYAATGGLTLTGLGTVQAGAAYAMS
ncbi:hypothetical protein ACSTJJ_23090, partial [Vibrio parahaemolyticus]